MDRTKYLELARNASIKLANSRNPEWSVCETVFYQGARYIPVAYKLSFKPDGSVRHTAVLRDLGADSVVEARLDEVGEAERSSNENSDSL